MWKLALIVLIGVLDIQRTMCQKSCVVSDFKVQENFDVEKYMGRWYEIKWTEPIFARTNPSGVWQNYQQVYSLNSDKKTIQGTIRYTAFDVPSVSDIADSRPYWVLTTDYTNYAVSYACRRNATNGTCDVAGGMSNLWVWSRTTKLTDAQKKIVDNKIAEVCLDRYKFLTTTHSTDCSTVSGADTLMCSLFMTIMVAVVSTLRYTEFVLL